MYFQLITMIMVIVIHKRSFVTLNSVFARVGSKNGGRKGEILG